MKISLNWIREFVDIPKNLSAQKLAELLTLRTCEVEGWEEGDERYAGLEGVVVGKLLAFEKIEGSDKLHKAQLDIGRSRPLQLIFGQMIEMRIGDHVPVAIAPTKLPTGLEVTAKTIRGVLTEGMLCLDQELGLRKDGVSIHYFPDTVPGTLIVEALKKEDQHKYDHVVIGKVLSVQKHPNADRLNVVEVDVGAEFGAVRIVCGGKNVAVGMVVAVALPGAKTFDHKGKKMAIAAANIRGQESFGMICADHELGLPKITQHPEEIIIADMKTVCAFYKMPAPKVGTPLAQVLSKPSTTDVIFDVDNKSLTHRPDLWGHYGMAREFSAFLEKPLKKFAPKISFPKKGEAVKVKIADKNVTARFLTAVVTGINVEPSPEWLSKRLQAAGMRPVNNIVDITNCVMLELGHPLHAFDRRVVASDSFVIRTAEQGETVETLDHKKRTLFEGDILVTNGERILGLGGVMGGLNSEITPQTTEIVLEISTWNHVMIRKTSQRHGIRSDAAQRFEKSLDPEIAGLAMQRTCELLIKICPTAQLAGPLTDVYLQKPKKITILVDTSKVQSKIGAHVKEADMQKFLKNLGFGVIKAKKGFLKVSVPSFRATKDINIEDDIVEEIARMYGYEKITPLLPALPIKLPAQNTERDLENKARYILSAGLGFSETSHYSFYGQDEIKKALLPEQLHVKIENPLTADQTHMRISLVPHLLKATAENLNRQDYVRMYEVGRTYIKSGDFFPKEEKFICGVLAGRMDKTKEKDAVFYEALATLQTFLVRLNAPEFRVDTSQTPPAYAHPAKCAAVWCGDAQVAIIFELHPIVAQNFGIQTETVAWEINFTKLAALGCKEPGYTPLPRFPGISIDISVESPAKTPVRQLVELIKKMNSPLVADVSVINIFERSEKEKSVTLRILLQSPERTLTDEEMQEVRQSIIGTYQKAGFVIRGV